MPTSTLDLRCPNGSSIPIEERPHGEIKSLHSVPIAPVSVGVWNPSFDITPAALITAWVTEHGIGIPIPIVTCRGKQAILS